ncbi:MAG TPA: hypothetical protein ENI88_02600 [Desulfobulbus sp.]|nr:hypothetical protein [Desulfobulbus sp.]
MVTRMTSRLRILCAAFVFALMSMASPTHLSAAAASSEVTYVDLYANTLRALNNGTLDKSTGKEAHSLNSALQKKLLALDDQLKDVKAASVKAEGSRQDELLDELVALGAERERLYLEYRNRLEQLVGGKGGAVVSAPTAGPTVEKPKATESADNAAADSSKRTFTFENIPEDISTGQFD